MKSKQKENEKDTREDRICTDPQGSYTGIPEDKHDVPVQDVDDL